MAYSEVTHTTTLLTPFRSKDTEDLLFGCLIILNCCDIGLTIFGVHILGLEEANPMSLIMPIFIFYLIKFFTLPAIWFYNRFHKNVIKSKLWYLLAGMFLTGAICNNIVAILRVLTS